MSAAHRQRTCAACGGELRENDKITIEPLIDGMIRYVACHWGHTTHPAPKRERRSR